MIDLRIGVGRSKETNRIVSNLHSREITRIKFGFGLSLVHTLVGASVPQVPLVRRTLGARGDSTDAAGTGHPCLVLPCR
jgi:hypothetical protein